MKSFTTARTQKSVGFIGLGNMGFPMAVNLAKGGYKVIAYDVSKDRLKEIEKKGVQPCDNVKKLASQA